MASIQNSIFDALHYGAFNQNLSNFNTHCRMKFGKTLGNIKGCSYYSKASFIGTGMVSNRWYQSPRGSYNSKNHNHSGRYKKSGMLPTKK